MADAPQAGPGQAGEADREAEQRFSRVFRLSPDAMCLSRGIAGPILDVNDRWETLFGYERAAAMGKTAQELKLYPGDGVPAALGRRSLERGCIRDCEIAMQDKAGRILHTVVSGAAIDTGQEPCFITIIRDATEQKRARDEALQQREQLTHLTRAAVLGELSGALAHELNQPLAAILTNAQAARRFLASDAADLDEIRAILDDIVNENKRAGEVIRRLRALFMKGESKLQPLDLNEIAREALELTRSNLIARKVAVALQLSPGPRTVRGDRVQLQQVLLNLIVNACEEMKDTAPASRRLTLSTGVDPAGMVQVAVSDTGPGIAPDVIGRIFEFFFTTKTHGLGFGLPISRAIIAGHGGSIEGINNADGGATFRIALPAYHGAS